MASKKVDKHAKPAKQGDKFTRYLVIGMIAFVLIAGLGAALAKNNSNSHVISGRLLLLVLQWKDCQLLRAIGRWLGVRARRDV